MPGIFDNDQFPGAPGFLIKPAGMLNGNYIILVTMYKQQGTGRNPGNISCRTYLPTVLYPFLNRRGKVIISDGSDITEIFNECFPFIIRGERQNLCRAGTGCNS